MSEVPKQTEDPPSDSEQKYRNLFEAANDAIMIFEPDQEIILDVNRRAVEIYGYERETLIGMSLKRLTMDVARGEVLIEQTLREGQIRDLETVHYHQDGWPINMLINATLIEHEGRPAILSINRDITAWKKQEEEIRSLNANLEALVHRRTAELERKNLELEQEIAQHKQTARALQESEHRLQAVLDNAGAVIFVKDRQGRHMLVNRQYEEIFQLSREEIEGKTDFDLMPEIIAEQLTANDRQVFETGQVMEFDEVVEYQGEQHTYLSVKFPLRDADNEIYAVCGISTDITERKRTAEALERSQRRLQALFENAMDAIMLVDDETCYVSVNPAACKLLGYSREELLQMSIWDVTSRDMSEQGKEFWREFLTSGQQQGEYKLERKDGAIIDLEYRAVANILPGLHLSVMRDVTERKRVEESLQESEERFRTLADSTPALIWMSGPNKEGFYFNKTWLDFTGRTLEQELGDGWIEAVHPEDRGAPMEVCEKAFIEQKPFQTQFRLRRADGQYCWMLDTGVPLFTPDSTLVGYIGSCIDITERKEMEEELRMLNEKLEERVRERTAQVRALASALTLTEHRERHRFAQILHNDLQQLLYALQMQLHLLPQPQPPTSPELLAQISHALDRAIHVTRTLTVDLSPPVLKEEGLKEALIWLSSQMNDLYKLQVDLRSAAPVYDLNEDMRVLLFQIIRELLFNVVRHAEVDQAQVSLDRTGQYIHLQVKDEGIGFDTAAVDKHRDNPDGFGLYNIRERLGLLNGQMEIDSRPGQGTSVDVIVPIKSADQEILIK